MKILIIVEFALLIVDRSDLKIAETERKKNKTNDSKSTMGTLSCTSRIQLEVSR